MTSMRYAAQPRRHAVMAVLAAAMGSGLALASCSGQSSPSARGSGSAASAAPASSQTQVATQASTPGVFSAVGTPDTDPSAPPRLLGSSQGKNQPVSHPAFYDLPTSWDPTSWYAQVAAVTGSPVVLETQGVQYGTPASRSWTKSFSRTKQENLGATLSSAGHPLWISCGMSGFDPTSSSDDALVYAVLQTCAGASIPGGDRSAALAWAQREERLAVGDLAKASPYQYLAIPTPEFGDEVLFMTAVDKVGGVDTINLLISSSEE